MTHSQQACAAYTSATHGSGACVLGKGDAVVLFLISRRGVLALVNFRPLTRARATEHHKLRARRSRN
jgi:hypothetical protein